MKNQIFTLVTGGILSLFVLEGHAQQKVKDGTVLPATSLPKEGAILDLESTQRALLFPRVVLTSTTAWGLNGATPSEGGYTVYNTNDGITSTNVNYPILTGTINGVGEYYWDGTGWVGKKFVAGGAGNFWSLVGNAGTTAGTNFLGTTDEQHLIFKVKGNESGRISYNNESVALTGRGGQTSLGYLSAINNAATRVTAIGDRALMNNQGTRNTGVGFSALKANTSGANNTALGASALVVNNIGSDNVGVGFATLQNLPDGNRNTAVGTRAGFTAHDGSDNTFLGNSAGYNNSTGSSNTLVGSLADLSSGNLTNAAAIGYNAKVAQSNSLVLGGTGTEAVTVGIGTTAPANPLQVVGKDAASGLAAGNFRNGPTTTHHIDLGASNNFTYLDFMEGTTMKSNIAYQTALNRLIINSNDTGFASSVIINLNSVAGAPRGNLGIGTVPNAASTLHVLKRAGDITPAIIEGCNEYANNAAALSAGVPIGGLYRTGDALKVVH